MQNEIQVFTNEEFGSVRTIEQNGEVWFIGKDVALALGYENTRDAIRRHVDAEDKTMIQRSVHSTLDIPNRGMSIISESGLYSLVFSSKLPAAKQFKHWITSEVIPAIRKHGTYFTDSVLTRLLSDPAQAHLLVMEYANEVLKNERLKIELHDIKPKAAYFDTFVNPREATNIRATAKELGVPEKRFTKYLLDNRYMYRAPSGKLMPYVGYYNKGYFIVRDFHKHNSSEVGQYTLFTAVGKAHFMDKVPDIMAN
jgi:prophage antirepressor-like protein